MVFPLSVDESEQPPFVESIDSYDRDSYSESTGSEQTGDSEDNKAYSSATSASHVDATTRLRRPSSSKTTTKEMPRSHQGITYDRLETGSNPGGGLLGGLGGGVFRFFNHSPPFRDSNGGYREYGGYGTGERQGIVRFTWKKLVVGAVVFVGLVWIVGPRMRGGGQSVAKGTKGDSGGTPYGVDIDLPENVPGPTGTKTFTGDTTSPTGGNKGVYYPYIDQIDDEDDDLPNPETTTSAPSTQHPTSHSDDPNPSGTTYCTSPANASLPLVQYALMIDAGSTGSRIHIYKFNNCFHQSSTPAFEYEVFKMTQPGLSDYAKKGLPALDAAKSLDVLLDEAMRVVPEGMRKCTPVAVKATAGLRLLPGKQSEEILRAIEERMREVYPFRLVDKDPVVVMDGKDEGVYAWITVNYLMGTIKEEESTAKRKGKETYAVLDLGGASTQIVFEPEVDEGGKGGMEEGEHKYDLKFSGRNHVLYQHSYLGYGLMRARKSVHRLVEFMDSVRASRPTSTTEGKETLIGNPCLSRGTQRVVEIEDEKNGEKKNVTMTGEGIGSFDGCSRLMQLVLAKDAICELKPCSFDGVYQPSLLTSFASGKVLLLSYFYDRLEPLLPPSSPTPITVSTLASYSKDVCQGRERWLELWGTKPDVMKELDGRPEWCLDLTFMYTLLRLGYEFEDKRQVKLGKKIKGTELGWCLGATIEMLGGGEVTCLA